MCGRGLLWNEWRMQEYDNDNDNDNDDFFQVNRCAARASLACWCKHWSPSCLFICCDLYIMVLLRSVSTTAESVDIVEISLEHFALCLATALKLPDI